MQCGDTSKFIASMAYQMVNDDPISFFQWELSAWPQAHESTLPWRYLANPGQERLTLENRIGTIFKDSGVTGFLMNCDYIEDVKIIDTIIRVLPDVKIKYMVIANCTIVDPIKGRYIPACPPGRSDGEKRHELVSKDSISITTYVPTLAAIGSCFQFEYSPNWERGPGEDAPMQLNGLMTYDQGWWVERDSEYIVFLNLESVREDVKDDIFMIKSNWCLFGTRASMYPVRKGIVDDPNDDFGLGGTNLPVLEWKARLRAKIQTIINPKLKTHFQFKLKPK